MRVIGSSVFSTQGSRPYQENFVLSDEEKGIVAVADGFGGAMGFEASKMAAEHARDFIIQKSEDLEATLPFELRRSFSLIQNVLNNAFSYANAKLLKWNSSKHIYERGGSSLSIGVLYQNVLTVGQSGSGSMWLQRKGRWTQLMNPRSLGFRNELQWNGAQAEIPLGAMGLMEDFQREFQETKIETGDWLLIASAAVSSTLIENIQGLAKGEYSVKEVAEAVQAECQKHQFESNASISLSFFG